MALAKGWPGGDLIESENKMEVSPENEYQENTYQEQVEPAYTLHTEEDSHDYVEVEVSEHQESKNLKLEDKEIEYIKIALKRNKGRRKKAADDLGISERTLYRKIKQYDLE